MRSPLDLVVEALTDVRVTRRCLVGGYALFIYDIILTFNEEWRYIWQAKWTSGKVLYLLIRYPWLILSTGTIYFMMKPTNNVELCRGWYSVESIGNVLEITLVELVMSLRTYALWDRNKGVLILLSILGPICMGGLIIPYAIILPLHTFLPNPAPGVYIGCYRICGHCKLWFRLFWVPVMVLDIVIFTLTFIKVYRLSQTQIKTPLMKKLFRDGFMYFLAVFSCVTSNFLVWNIMPDTLIEVMTTYTRTIMSLMTCRLILNLRGALDTNTGDNTFVSSYLMTDVNKIEDMFARDAELESSGSSASQHIDSMGTSFEDCRDSRHLADEFSSPPPTKSEVFKEGAISPCTIVIKVT